MARLTKAQQAEREEAKARLREWLSPGDTVYGIVRHVSRSGMLRVIDLKVASKDGDGRMWAIGYNAAVAMGDKWDREREGIRVTGCGMDMIFALVYNLGHALWPDGFDLPTRVILGPDCRTYKEPDAETVNPPRETVKIPRRCRCHVDPQPCGFVCSSCGCRTVPDGARNGSTDCHEKDGGYALRSSQL